MNNLFRLIALVSLMVAPAIQAEIFDPHPPHGGGGGGPIIIDPDPGHDDDDHGPIFSEVSRRTLHCASGQYRYNQCYVGGLILAVRVNRQLSSARCLEGRTFGHYYDQVWVDRGCRAIFDVYYKPYWGGFDFLELN